MEGDDYWLDPFTLKKRIDALFNHPEVAMVSNKLLLRYDKGNGFDRYVVQTYPDYVEEIEILSSNIQARDNYASNYSSSLYRTSALSSIDVNIEDLPSVGDWFVHFLLSCKGGIFFINEPLSVYRIHDRGVWSGSPLRQLGEHKFKKLTDFINNLYPDEYKDELEEFLGHWEPVHNSIFYFDTGSGFSEECTLKVPMRFYDDISFSCTLDTNDIPKGIKSLRFDPEEGHLCKLTDFAVYADERPVDYTVLNGSDCSGSLVFLTNDPSILIPYSRKMKKAKKIFLKGKIIVSDTGDSF